MKKIICLLVFSGFAQQAFSMPCDTGYDCVSKTGKYKVALQRCRYRNNINLIKTTINGSEVTEAILNQGWDGENILAFEINLPVKIDGAVKVLTAELPHNHKMGIMKIKYADSQPGPLTILHTEKINCVISE